MSSIGITSSLGNLSQVASTGKAAPVPSKASPVQTSPALRPDIVTLSMSGQAKLMHQQGNSPALIASSLGIKVADVDGYLGIKVAVAAVATPAPSETPALAPSSSAPVAGTRTDTPEATVPASPAPQRVATRTPSPNS